MKELIEKTVDIINNCGSSLIDNNEFRNTNIEILLVKCSINRKILLEQLKKHETNANNFMEIYFDLYDKVLRFVTDEQVVDVYYDSFLDQDLGFDSLDKVDFQMEIEHNYLIEEITDKEMKGINTFGDVLEIAYLKNNLNNEY